MFEQTKLNDSYLSMASYDDSLEHILAAAKNVSTVPVAIKNAVGKVLAEDIVAPISVPSFNNSAMDGFAFNSRCTKNASSAKPVCLPIVGASIAGDAAGVSCLQSGYAAKIMTGAPLPDNADTILPVEYASWNHEKLSFYAPYSAHKHVRLVGQDIEKGETVLNKGTRISSHHIPLLCAMGLNNIAVFSTPTVSWITTGQEISDDFEKPLNPGHIYNATGLYGAVSARGIGANIIQKVTVRDTPQDFALALDNALERKADIIVSTGGVSAGQYDFVRPVLEEAGAKILLHKARIKPGKPVLFAVLPCGTYFFGLPGNPISTALALRCFVYPFILRLAGLPPEIPRSATLTSDCVATKDKTVFLMADALLTKNGSMTITPKSSQQSFQTLPFAKSNAWIIVPEGMDEVKAGEIVSWLPLTPGELQEF